MKFSDCRLGSLVLIALALSFTGNSCAQEAPALHAWISTDGRVTQAKFIRIEGESVVIEKDGGLFAVPLEKLSPTSLELARKLSKGRNVTAERPPQILVKVLALNYDPKFQGQVLHEAFHWSDPRLLAKNYMEDMESASGGMIKFDIVEWRDLDEIYARDDGGRFTIEEYVRNRRAGKGWPAEYNADYPRIIAEQKVVSMVDAGRVDEVWIFSDHYFGLLEASMAGPGAFFINGGVYPQVPSKRPFAFYGFNYQRGVAEMLHNTSHRAESTMNRIYGKWNLKNPQNNWEKFSANSSQSNGVAGVGTCHWPANAMRDYDYGNLRVVNSWADDFLNYPNLSGQTKKVSFATWSEKGGDHHRNYMKWYFGHLPRAPGVNPDGRLNNWWRYLYDFTNYTQDGKPLAASVSVMRIETSGPDTVIHLAYRSAKGILPQSFDLTDVVLVIEGDREIKPTAVQKSDERLGNYCVAAYRFPTVEPSKLGQCILKLGAAQVSEADGNSFVPTEWAFLSNAGTWEGIRLVPDRNTPHKIAEWVIQLGGKVGSTGMAPLITEVTNLPAGDEFEIDRLMLPTPPNGSAKREFADLLPLRQLKALHTLDLRNSSFGDKGARWIAHTFPALTDLNLHACELTDESMEDLATLAGLEYLDIGYSRSKITDVGASHFLSLQQLKKLNIYDSGITDKTLLEVFAKLPALASVELLATKVTASGVAKFKQLKPNCRVVGLDRR